MALKTLKVAKISAYWNGYFMSLFIAVLIGFSLVSWYIGGIFIENGKINPTTGEAFNVVDIMVVS